MHLYPLLILIAVLFVIGLIWRRKVNAQIEASQSEQSVSATADSSSDMGTQFTTQLRARLRSLRNGFGDDTSAPDTVILFRTWSDHALVKKPEILAWLSALTDEQIKALITHLDNFCQDMGFELSWLLEQQITHSPQMATDLTAVVLHYIQACYRAVALQEEVQLFRVYHEYVQNPESRQHRELGQHLFGKLMDQGVTKISISEHFAASARLRQTQIVETIQKTAAEQPKLFYTTLRTTLLERAAGESPTLAPPADNRVNGAPNQAGAVNGAANRVADSSGSNHGVAKSVSTPVTSTVS